MKDSSSSDITEEQSGACLLLEKRVKAEKVRRLLAEGENDISAGRVRSARSFLKEFKADRDIS